MIAAQRGDEQMVRLLLTRGADPGLRAQNGKDAEKYAFEGKPLSDRQHAGVGEAAYVRPAGGTDCVGTVSQPHCLPGKEGFRPRSLLQAIQDRGARRLRRADGMGKLRHGAVQFSADPTATSENSGWKKARLVPGASTSRKSGRPRIALTNKAGIAPVPPVGWVERSDTHHRGIARNLIFAAISHDLDIRTARVERTDGYRFARPILRIAPLPSSTTKATVARIEAGRVASN